MTTPPIDRRAGDGALHELTRLACDLPDLDADEARRRLERLTAEQRAVVEGTLERLADS
ncbi:MAG: hypothetical protein ACAH79_03860 [Thermoleophilia bacterium]